MKVELMTPLHDVAKVHGVKTATIERRCYRAGIQVFNLAPGGPHRSLAIRAADVDQLQVPIEQRQSVPLPDTPRRLTIAEKLARINAI